MGAAAGVGQMALGGFQILAGQQQGASMRRQAEIDARQSEFNASLIDFQKRDIAKQRDEDIFLRERQVNQMLGSQKVSLAAQGIEVDGELGEAFAEQERKIGLEDIQAIKNNAWRASMGLEIKKQDLLMEAKATRLRGESAANARELSGILQGAGNIVQGAGKFKPKYSKNDYTDPDNRRTERAFRRSLVDNYRQRIG